MFGTSTTSLASSVRSRGRRGGHVAPTPLVALPAVDIDIDVPAGWARRDEPGPALLVARPPDWRRPLVPSLTVTRLVATETPTLAAYGERMVASTLLSLGGHLVHLDSGHRPCAHIDLTLATEQWGADVTVTLRHVVTPGGEAVAATGVAADDDWSGLALALMRAVRSLRARWHPGETP
jgi:hypothetical protein